MQTIYDVSYFIQKFEAIPEDKWCTGTWENASGKRCAGGHCCAEHSFRKTDEFRSLEKILLLLWISPKRKYDFSTPFATTIINDGETNEYQQPTPKQRILAALYDIKKMQDGEDFNRPKVKEVIRYVSVPETIKKQSKEIVLS